MELRIFTETLRYLRVIGVLSPILLLSACASLHPDHDDLIHIAVENTSDVEKQVFERYFREEINDEIEEDYVAKPIATRSAKFSLKLTVLSAPQAGIDPNGKVAKPTTTPGSAPPPDFTYKIRLDLTRNSDKQVVWTYHPDRGTSYSDYRKSIKWLARYSAKQIEKQGLMKDKYLQ